MGGKHCTFFLNIELKVTCESRNQPWYVKSFRANLVSIVDADAFAPGVARLSAEVMLYNIFDLVFISVASGRLPFS